MILDGAHNPQGAEVLANTWREQYCDRKAVLVFSAVAAKDVSGILALLVPVASRIHFCPVDTPRALPVEEIAASLPAGAPPYECHTGFDAAFDAAMLAEGPILVAGSLFLVGEAKARLQGGNFQPSMQ